jgi:pimeloyl-ACP methyl ester carboxylesterase
MLSLRSEPRGGDPQPPSENALIGLLAYRRIVFLVHGYNNDQDFATKAFGGCETMQRELAGLVDGGDYAQGWHIVRVFWPGDADWSLASALFYMGAIGNARRTGVILAEVIQQLSTRGNLTDVMFVAHSLGCRVVLETLLNLAAANVRVLRTVFFAAAVPTFKLEEQNAGRLGWAAQKIEDEWLSLYSANDPVLAITFPLGQSLAPGNEGAAPTALGHDLWAAANVTAVLGQAENPGAGHSDYWGWETKTRDREGRFANSMARAALQLEPVEQNRPLRSRGTVVRGIEAREIAAREQELREPLPHYY